jgi:hypothetical protein
MDLSSSVATKVPKLPAWALHGQHISLWLEAVTPLHTHTL